MKARKTREKTPEHTDGLENTSQETETRGKQQVESRRMHTRGAQRQDPEAKEITPERRKLQITNTGKEEPRTS